MADNVAHPDGLRAFDHRNHFDPVIEEGRHAHGFPQVGIQLLHANRGHAQ